TNKLHRKTFLDRSIKKYFNTIHPSLLKTSNAIHKTAGAIQQAHIPFYYIKLITILQLLFLI
ncbi:hypothetical protein FW364_26730, partial [Escherichia coli]|nr:hypothetical protein [Escherichia coli]